MPNFVKSYFAVLPKSDMHNSRLLPGAQPKVKKKATRNIIDSLQCFARNYSVVDGSALKINHTSRRISKYRNILACQ